MPPKGSKEADVNKADGADQNAEELSSKLKSLVGKIGVKKDSRDRRQSVY